MLRGRVADLRPLRRSDAAPLDRILRDAQVTRMLPLRVRRESGREWVDRVLREQRRGDGCTYAVLAKEAPDVTGQIRFVNWSRVERHAEIGCWIGRRYWGRGLASDAVRLLCRYGFGSLGLHRIEATVVVGNRRSLRMLDSVGFRREGRTRRSAWISGRWADEWVLGLLRGELRSGGEVPLRGRRP